MRQRSGGAGQMRVPAARNQRAGYAQVCEIPSGCGLTADVIVDEVAVPPPLLDEDRSQNALVERLEPLGLVIKVLLSLLQRRHAFLALFVHALLCLDRASGCLF